MKRFVALLMVLAISLGLVGCVPPQKPLGDGNDVIIHINLTGAGYGDQWLKDSKARFEQLTAQTKYGENDQYEGVFISINSDSGVTADKYNDTPNHIVFGGGMAQNIASYGTVLNLSADGFDGLTGEPKDESGLGLNVYEEIYNNTGVNADIKSIYDLIKEDDKANYVAKQDGEVYALPTFEVFAGATYDKDLFDKSGYYFADTTKTSKTIKLDKNSIPLLSTEEDGVAMEGYDEIVFHLVNKSTDLQWEQHKSVGPDGLPNTQDDGLPSSLLEFIALCAYMKKQGVYPLQFTGKYAADYSDTFIYGLVFSLLGEDRAKVTRTFEGEVEVVTSFTGQNGPGDATDPVKYLIPALKKIRLPKTQVVNVTEETGFYTQYSAERYYAMALMELFKAQDWFAPGSDPVSGSIDHIAAEENFVFSNHKKPNGSTGTKIAFLSESSYWYNEAKTALNNFKTYNNNKERGIRWYPYPVNIANSVTGQDTTATTHGITESVKGEKNVIAMSKATELTVNKKAIEKASDPTAVLAAIKDFLQFWYSEDELANTTIAQGMGRNMTFQMPEEKLGDWAGFYKELNDLKEDSYVLPMSSDSDTFMKSLLGIFKLGEGGRYFNCCRQFTCDLLNGEHDAKYGFEQMLWTPEEWKGYYQKGYLQGTVDTSNIKYIKINGVDLTYSAPYDDWV